MARTSTAETVSTDSAPEPAAPERKPSRLITIDKMRPASGGFTTYSATPYAGTLVEEVLVPSYWKHVARKFKPNDEIRVVPEDGKWRALLYVAYATGNELFVQVIHHVTLSAIDPKKLRAGGYHVEWIGSAAGWAVVRDSDGAHIGSKFPTEEAAAAFLASHVKVMNR